VRPGSEMWMPYFYISSGTSTDRVGSAAGHVTPNLCFCIWRDLWVMYCSPVCLGREMSMHYFFMLGWDRYGCDRKHTKTHYAKLMFLHPVGSTGHVVYSGSSEPLNNDAVFFILGWPGSVSIKTVSGCVAPNLNFCIRWDLWVT
jgi:hypothetical protein